MSLQVIGAGLGRTGTSSLKLALEYLLGGRCYHMFEVLRNPSHVAPWNAAVRGDFPEWETIFGDFVATVDWPGAAFWRELSQAYPDAIVLLSQRASADEWFRSAESTLNQLMQRRPPPNLREWHAMTSELLRTRFVPMPFERDRAIEAYDRHNADVRAAIPATRLLEWRTSDGWEPLCERLHLPVPEIPFPHKNTRSEFHELLDSRRSWMDRLRYRRLAR